jgi:hypothetical protein
MWTPKPLIDFRFDNLFILKINHPFCVLAQICVILVIKLLYLPFFPKQEVLEIFSHAFTDELLIYIQTRCHMKLPDAYKWTELD